MSSERAHREDVAQKSPVPDSVDAASVRSVRSVSPNARGYDALGNRSTKPWKAARGGGAGGRQPTRMSSQGTSTEDAAAEAASTQSPGRAQIWRETGVQVQTAQLERLARWRKTGPSTADSLPWSSLRGEEGSQKSSAAGGEEGANAHTAHATPVSYMAKVLAATQPRGQSTPPTETHHGGSKHITTAAGDGEDVGTQESSPPGRHGRQKRSHKGSIPPVEGEQPLKDAQPAVPTNKRKKGGAANQAAPQPPAAAPAPEVQPEQKASPAGSTPAGSNARATGQSLTSSSGELQPQTVPNHRRHMSNSSAELKVGWPPLRASTPPFVPQTQQHSGRGNMPRGATFAGSSYCGPSGPAYQGSVPQQHATSNASTPRGRHTPTTSPPTTVAAAPSMIASQLWQFHQQAYVMQTLQRHQFPQPNPYCVMPAAPGRGGSAPFHYARATNSPVIAWTCRELGRDLGLFEGAMTLSETAVAEREAFLRVVGRVVRRVLGSQATLCVHGSYKADLSVPGSDVDIAVSGFEVSPRTAMECIASELGSLTVTTASQLGAANIDQAEAVSDDAAAFEGSCGQQVAQGIVQAMVAAVATEGEDSEPAAARTRQGTPIAPADDVPVVWGGTASSSPPATTASSPAFTINTVPFARVPIIKVFEPRTGIHGDVACGGGDPLRSHEFVIALLARFPNARKLILALKMIVRQLSLAEGVRGGVSSFALYLMVCHFMSHRQKEKSQFEQYEPAVVGTASIDGLNSRLGSLEPGDVESEVAAAVVRPPAEAAGSPSAGAAERSASTTSENLALHMPPDLAATEGEIQQLRAAEAPDVTTLESPVAAVPCHAVEGGSRATSPGGLDDISRSSTCAISEEAQTAADGVGAVAVQPRDASASPTVDAGDMRVAAEDREAGELFLDFCYYFGFAFDYQTKGIRFYPDGVSEEIAKPSQSIAKGQHMVLTSPFDPEYDIAQHMAKTEGLQEALQQCVTTLVYQYDPIKQHSLYHPIYDPMNIYPLTLIIPSPTWLVHPGPVAIHALQMAAIAAAGYGHSVAMGYSGPNATPAGSPVSPALPPAAGPAPSTVIGSKKQQHSSTVAAAPNAASNNAASSGSRKQSYSASGRNATPTATAHAMPVVNSAGSYEATFNAAFYQTWSFNHAPQSTVAGSNITVPTAQPAVSTAGVLTPATLEQTEARARQEHCHFHTGYMSALNQQLKFTQQNQHHVHWALRGPAATQSTQTISDEVPAPSMVHAPPTAAGESTSVAAALSGSGVAMAFAKADAATETPPDFRPQTPSSTADTEHSQDSIAPHGSASMHGHHHNNNQPSWPRRGQRSHFNASDAYAAHMRYYQPPGAVGGYSLMHSGAAGPRAVMGPHGFMPGQYPVFAPPPTVHFSNTGNMHQQPPHGTQPASVAQPSFPVTPQEQAALAIPSYQAHVSAHMHNGMFGAIPSASGNEKTSATYGSQPSTGGGPPLFVAVASQPPQYAFQGYHYTPPVPKRVATAGSTDRAYNQPQALPPPPLPPHAVGPSAPASTTSVPSLGNGILQPPPFPPQLYPRYQPPTGQRQHGHHSHHHRFNAGQAAGASATMSRAEGDDGNVPPTA